MTGFIFYFSGGESERVFLADQISLNRLSISNFSNFKEAIDFDIFMWPKV